MFLLLQVVRLRGNGERSITASRWLRGAKERERERGRVEERVKGEGKGNVEEKKHRKT